MNSKEFLNEHDITFTTLRAQMIEILQHAKNPVSYDELVAKTGANKTTIYRNIELFSEKGLIISSENNRKSFYELAEHAKAYFVCENCHKMEEISMPEITQKHVKSVIVKEICDECSK